MQSNLTTTSAPAELHDFNWPRFNFPDVDMPQFDLPLTDVLQILLYMALTMIFLWTAICGPIIASMAEGRFVISKKAFFKKFAQQASQLSFWAAFPVYLFLLAYALYSVQTAPPGVEPLDGLQNMMPGMAIPFLWAVFFMTYRFTWKILKDNPRFHFLIGFCSALLCIGTLVLSYLAILCLLQPAFTEMLWDAPLPRADGLSTSSLGALLNEFSGSSTAWLLLGYYAFTGLTCAACFVLVWLVVMRKYADYGRDYYNFAMRAASRWAIFFQIPAFAFWICAVEVLKASPLSALAMPVDISAQIMAAAPSALCLLFWCSVAFSKTPLRNKPGALFACLAFFIGLCMQFYTLFRAMPVL